MRYILSAVVSVAILCTPIGEVRNGVFAEGKGEKQVTVSTFQSKTKKPKVKAEGAISYCGETGDILFGKNVDAHLDPLSMTKVMTCYIAMKQIDEGKIKLSTKFTATKQDVKVMESKLYLQKGEQMPVKDLIYAALLHSANDAAAVLGTGISGSKKEFAKLMNKEARALGCTNTNFVNANGLIEKDHYSSPRDMALIAEAAFKYDFLRKVCRTKMNKLAPTNKYDEEITVTTTNPFFHKRKKVKKPYKKYNILGGKTGTWEDWNAALMEVSGYGDKTIYTIVMNDDVYYRYKDTVKLIEHGRKVLDEKAEYEKAMERAEAAKAASATVTEDSSSGEPAGPADVVKRGLRAVDAGIADKFNALMDRSIPLVRVSQVDPGKQVIIKWDRIQGAHKYRVFRAEGDGSFVLLKEIPSEKDLSFTDETCEKDKVYRYFIRAAKEDGGLALQLAE